MTSDEFWHGDMRLAAAYREKYRLESERRDREAWQEGYYTFTALVSASPAFRELSEGVDFPYPKHPLFAARLSEEELAEERQREAMEKLREAVKAMAMRANAKRAERETKKSD